jgi:hypothetical protein
MLTADNCCFDPAFQSKMDPKFRGTTEKDQMSFALRRKKKALRFCHTLTEHAEALARIAARDERAA